MRGREIIHLRSIAKGEKHKTRTSPERELESGWDSSAKLALNLNLRLHFQSYRRASRENLISAFEW